MLNRGPNRDRRAGARGVLALAAALALAGPLAAQMIQFTELPPGYVPDSVTLPRAFAGALAVDPEDDAVIYVSVGAFLDTQIVRLDLRDRTARVVAAGPFGNIGGIAPLAPGRLALIENSVAAGSGLPGETLLLATDVNLDGDFDDLGEIVELIAPILTGAGGDFSGAQARVAPAGNPSGIPSGSVLLQTADGGGEAELLVVTNPLGMPAFRPGGGAYFGGFDFSGGFDFDSQGRIILGAVEGTAFTGQIFALVNLNGDEAIDPGESGLLAQGLNGIFDLVIDAADRAYFTGPDEDFIAGIRTFQIPENPLAETATITTLARTNSGFLTGLILTSKTKSFAPAAGPEAATLLFGGFTSSFEAATNLLLLTPLNPLNRVHGWRRYE